MKNNQKGFIDLFVVLVIVLLIGGGAYMYNKKKQVNKSTVDNSISEATTTVLITNQSATTTQISSPQTASWKIYQNQEFGLKMKYPPQYSVDDNSSINNPKWTQMNLLAVYDPTKPSSKAGFPTILNVTLEKQSSVFSKGELYHTIDDFITGYYGNKSSAYEFISTKNGVRVAHYLSEYIFMKNDLIYEFQFDSKSPYIDDIIQSVEFR